MSHPAITLTTTDQAAVNMLATFRALGFQETEWEGVLAKGETYLVVVEPPIVPTEEYAPSPPYPYPADYDDLAKQLDIAFYAVASRHASKSEQPSLTFHATGNFADPTFGGRPRELQAVPVNAMRNVFLESLKDTPSGYAVSLEATHHGPTEFRTPLFFAEVGSSPAQWGDKTVCSFLASAILRGIEEKGSAKAAIGFSGGHYCPKYSPMEREYAFGHIAAKYALPSLDDALIRQMAEKTLGPVEVAFIEDGARGSDKRRISEALKLLGVPLEVI